MNTDPISPGDAPPWWRRALPFVVTAILIAWVASRIDFGAFVRSLARVDYVGFVVAALVFNVLVLPADALGAVHVYRKVAPRVGFWELVVIRGASYLPSMVNHHVGQAWLTYFMARVYRAPMQRVVGATLIVYATTLGVLVSFLAAAWCFGKDQIPALGPVLVGLCVAAMLYAAVLALKPKLLAERPLLAPLFESGIAGHLSATLWRVPHMLVQLAGAWIPLAFFGVKLPIAAAFAQLPVILFVVALPLTAQGLGTREALSITLLSPYAVGTPGERAASIAAATVSWLVTILLIQLVTSLAFMRTAEQLLRRTGASAMETPSVSS